MRVSESDLAVLVALRDDPLDSYSGIAAKLNLAPNTVKSKIKKLKDEGVLRADGEIKDPVLGVRRITETVTYVKTETLGLKRLYFLLEDVPSYESYLRICRYLDNHPYTTFRVLCVGNKLNLYVEFQIPEAEVQLLKKFMRSIREMQLYTRMIYINPVNVVFGKDDLKRWDNYTLSWDLNIAESPQSGEKSIKDLFMTYLDQTPPEQNLPKAQKSDSRIDPLNLQLLRELTINAKFSVQYLSSFYEKDRTTISRRIKFVRENYVDHYSVNYNKRIFHLGTSFLIYGSIDARAGNAIKQLVQHRDIQFYSEYVESKKQFFWKIDAPTIFVNALFRLIAPYCTDIGQLAVHTETNTRYFFYHLNYDGENKHWKGGEDYIVNDPLK